MGQDDGDWLVWSRHVLAELKRFDKSHDLLSEKFDKMDDKLDHHNDSLLRNIVTLEEHVKKTNLLENKVVHVEDEVDGLKDHISSVSKYLGLLQFLFSEKFLTALKVIAVIGSIITAYQLKDFKFLKHFME